jgi:hypothetical protein
LGIHWQSAVNQNRFRLWQCRGQESRDPDNQEADK